MAYIGPVSDYMYIEMSLELVDSPRFSISNFPLSIYYIIIYCWKEFFVF